MNTLVEALNNWKRKRAIVVGDVMLDRLTYGDAERLTADAPVPVLAVRKREHRPGGAANVCQDLIALGCDVTLLTVIGADHDGDLLLKELSAWGIDTTYVIKDPTRPTTIKESLIGLAQHRHPQKMFRLDTESRDTISSEIAQQLKSNFEAALSAADVVAIEDYNKGLCTEEVCQGVIASARKHAVPVLIDPAAISDFTKYAGCNAITPNRTEAERATGLNVDSGARSLAEKLQNDLNCEAVVLTLDKDGALLLERNSCPLEIPTVAREVYDVTGAGDMVLAALCGATSNGFPWKEAVELANIAAGMEVEVFGVQPIALEQLHSEVLRRASGSSRKIRSVEHARIEIKAARRDGKRIVFTNGCFDVLHAGHIRLLRDARAFGDLLVVGINSDASISRLKGPERPVNHLDDRLDVLSELESIDLLVPFEDDTPVQLLEILKPDVLCKGADYSIDQVVGGDFVQSYGGSVQLIEVLKGRSSTRTIERVGL